MSDWVSYYKNNEEEEEEEQGEETIGKNQSKDACLSYLL